MSKTSASTIAALLFLAASATATPPKAADGWERVSSSDRVDVYVRARANSPVREVLATGIVAAPAWVLKNVVDDIPGYTALIPFTTVAKVIGHEGPTAISLQRLEMPFFQAREYVVRVNDTSRVEGGVTILGTGWVGAMDTYGSQVDKNAVPVIVNEGSWSFEALADGRSRATFRLMVDPAGVLPPALVAISQRLMMGQYLENLERRSRLPAYRRQVDVRSGRPTAVVASAGGSGSR